MHIGKINQELSYEMGGKVLKVSEEERDLGVMMHRSAKPSRQWGFELRGTVDKVWANNTGEKEEQRRLNQRL